MDLTLLPENLVDFLLPGEEFLAAVEQSRLKHPVNPGIVAVTNMRVLVQQKSTLGLRSEIVEVQYRDLASVGFKKGIIFGTLTVNAGSGKGGELEHFDNTQARDLAKIANTKIRETMLGSGDAVSAVLTTKSVIEHHGSPGGGAPVAVASADDPIKIAKVRFAKGEITKAQLDEIIAALS